jgi:L-alanine-DL-glutamate epimerase-like enolase superfamily enzyme
MKIADIRVRVFTYTAHEKRDRQGHTHAVPPYQAKQALLTIIADDGSEGHCFGPAETVRPFVIDNHVRATLVGQDPFHRERLWQTLADAQRTSGGHLTDKTIAIVEMALWDWAGRKLGIPVYKMIGAQRDKVPAYGSTMCGDEQKGGLATPEAFARFAVKLVQRGYKAIKLHTWNTPIAWAPDPKMDAKACAAVREAVGPDIALMLDPYSSYSRVDALWLGRQIQALDFAWYEEPMNEASISSYVWLAQNLDIPIVGPETMTGKHHTRAEWIKAGACDITRTGVSDVGGIGPSLKVIHLAESFGMECEIHREGPGNLTLCAVQSNGRWYERGLLHPFVDYDAVPPYLNRSFDEMDSDGFVHLPQIPGLGYDINFEYIGANLVNQT